MKKLWSAAAVFAILAVMVLGAYTENRADGSALNFPNVEWGMTWEEVMTAAGIAEEVVGDLADIDHRRPFLQVVVRVHGGRPAQPVARLPAVASKACHLVQRAAAGGGWGVDQGRFHPAGPQNLRAL